MIHHLTVILFVKWYVWEDSFRESIENVRKKELKSLRSYLLCDAMLSITWGIIPTLVGLITFLVHTKVRQLFLEVF
jgi:hypothetical protein